MSDTRETIMTVARRMAQAHGYGGLSFRELASAIGIKSASIHYHFPTKGDLGAALARRYTEDARARLDAIAQETGDLGIRLRRYAGIFRVALANGNRMCLCGFMAAEHDDLPDAVKAQVQAFADVNIDWLSRILAEAELGATPRAKARRARAIFAAISGAQLIARSRDDIALYDEIIASYCSTGLIPA
jgi:TetR/AcrR family transcriptional repressor of nem operon